MVPSASVVRARALAVLVTACVLIALPAPAQGFQRGGASRSPTPSPSAAAASLPLLGDDGVHLYVQEAYEGFSAEITAQIAKRYRELVSAGMDCVRHLFDWGTLQPEPDVVDTAEVIEAMDARTAAGTPHHFVNISVVDSFGPEVIPAFAADLLEAGVPWDDPRIVAPFEDMLTELVPIMLERGMYMIGFANEPGGYYENDPVAAAAFTRFVRSAIAHTRTLSDQLATTIVFAGPDDAAIPHLMPLVDVATFNGYAYTQVVSPTCTIDDFPLPLFQSTGGAFVTDLLDQMIEAADGRLICIQEFGQATGWDDAPETLGPGAGLERQREIMVALVAGLAERREHFRTVSIWTLNDHTRDGMKYFSAEILAEGLPRCFADNVAEIFGPTGLVRSDAWASKKPAYDVVRDSIRPLREGRPVPFEPVRDPGPGQRVVDDLLRASGLVP